MLITIRWPIGQPGMIPRAIAYDVAAAYNKVIDRSPCFLAPVIWSPSRSVIAYVTKTSIADGRTLVLSVVFKDASHNGGLHLSHENSTGSLCIYPPGKAPNPVDNYLLREVVMRPKLLVKEPNSERLISSQQA